MTRGNIILAAAALLLAAGAGSAQSIDYRLPAAPIPAALADDQARIVVANCSACHSLDYIVTQPRGKGEQFWRDSVAKMINVYSAPISPENAEAVGTELARRFGAAG